MKNPTQKFTLTIALALTLASGYVSIVGLSEMFGPAMGGIAVILECAKVATTCFLARHWRQALLVHKLAMPLALAVMMLISAVGSYGYLLNAFKAKALATDSLVVDIQSQHTAINAAQVTLDALNGQVNALPQDYATGRRRMLLALQPQMDAAEAKIAHSLQMIDADQKQMLEAKINAGPLMAASERMGITIDQLTGWLMLGLVLVFDPLAVLLMSASAVMIEEPKKKGCKPMKKTKTVKRKASARAKVAPLRVDVWENRLAMGKGVESILGNRK